MSILKQYLDKLKQKIDTDDSTEASHRSSLEGLLTSLRNDISAINEPKHIECGAPDFIIYRNGIPTGYIETKNVGEPLDPVENSEQLKRYRESLSSLILTNYIEFRWYVNGEKKISVMLAEIDHLGGLRILKDNQEAALRLFNRFFDSEAPTISESSELAQRMASLARFIRILIENALQGEPEEGSLHSDWEGFREVLLPDLSVDNFADMYSQTICYGLFAARCNHNEAAKFDRRNAADNLPETNPFLRKLFHHIAGFELDARIAWAVDDLAELLNRADMNAILKDWSGRARREDPVIHFYETFLSAYDPELREKRGVYYTPEPIVSFIVRSVDFILKRDFGLKAGLADHSKIKIKTKNGEKEYHKVLILDPAAGTGTFLYWVINHIYESFLKNLGMWPAYVSKDLLPRIFGFEVQMAPYAVAHMKLGLQLKETGYDFRSAERLGIYLTNTLEESKNIGKVPFAQWIADEARAAGDVKRKFPVMVVLGNPPYYGHSLNKGDWIVSLLKGKDTMTGETTHSYFEIDGEPLKERNPKWLNDDYVKFIRFAQMRIEQTGQGILAFISNHGYLDNPTFRGMRSALMNTFDDIYILDLHGNVKKKEKCPDGSKDENVFDIQQGNAIGIFVKKPEKTNETTVRHAELWGERKVKYSPLLENFTETVEWEKLKPESPFYLFKPFDKTLLSEFNHWWKITDIVPVNSVGIVTARDSLTIHFDEKSLLKTVKDFAGMQTEEARYKYKLGKDVRDWKVEWAQNDINQTKINTDKITPIHYRPFDIRYTYYTGKTRGFICMPRREIMHHFRNMNFGLITVRQVAEGVFNHAFVTDNIGNFRTTLSNKGGAYIFPIYLYPDPSRGDLFPNGSAPTDAPGGRKANLSDKFIAELSLKLGLNSTPDGEGDLDKSFGPEDVFHYIYAMFHSPAYRERYAEFLRLDFPRVPMTSNRDLFRKLTLMGKRLTALHLIQEYDLSNDLALFPVMGSCKVDYVRYSEPGAQNKGSVQINSKQCFSNVPPEVWEFHIGGYQVCHKWLKDRKGRTLSFEELEHYRKIVSALKETIGLMEEIDRIIDEHGGWPRAFD